MADPNVGENQETPVRKGTKYWLSAWVPVAVGVGIIMLESSDFFGANHTSHPLRWIWESIFGPVSNAQLEW